MDKLYGLIQDINPTEICSHIEAGNLAEWCNAWRIAAKESLQIKTNADRIRAMSEKELAEFLAKKFTDNEVARAEQKGDVLTATYLHELAYTWFKCWMQWLREPFKEGSE